MVRDLALVGFGALVGFSVAWATMMAAAHDIRATDDLLRSLALRFQARTEGHG